MCNKINWDIIIDMLQQIVETLERIQWAFTPVATPDFFENSIEGLEKLDAISMKLLAIGEILKKIDQKTNKSLFSQYSGIDWTGFIGLRDVIAHGYYNIDPVRIFDICSKETEPLELVIKKIINDLKSETENRLK
ncbi:MAG: DUF86 domain-containing protein [Planctomycetaceae bacterium]|jgi:uncharacterized protein with HEPN domain|nr:DUF86 domain-containing protein [Planctomycetaceae bacterium]